MAMVVMVAIGINSAVKRDRLTDNRRRLGIGLVVALVIGVAVSPGAYGPGNWLCSVGVVLGVSVIVSSLFDPIDRWRRKLSLSRAVLGMTLAHVGLGVCVIA